MLSQIQDYISSLGYNFSFDGAKPKQKWVAVNDASLKGSYIYNEINLKDGTAVLVLTIYDYIKQQSYTEQFSTRELSQYETKRIQKEIEEQGQEAQAEKEKKWKECREYCETEWGLSRTYDSTNLEGEHPYFKRKQLAQIRCLEVVSSRIRSRPTEIKTVDLLFRIEDTSGTFWGYQIIREDGKKDFLPNQRVESCFFRIDPVSSSNVPHRIYVCEGVATALSVYLALDQKYLVVASFSASNLKSVTKALREKYPKAPIVICADNDAFKPDKGNAGIQAAEKALVDGSSIVIPEFEDTTTKPTDFNDLHCLMGLLEVKRQLLTAVIERPQVIYYLGFTGKQSYFTTARNPQVQAFTEFSSSDIYKLCNREYWAARYPTKSGLPDFDHIKSDLIEQSQKVGIFEPSRIRGRGVWLDQNQLIINRGDKIILENGSAVDIQDFETEFFYDPRDRMKLGDREELSEADRKLTVDILSHLSLSEPLAYQKLLGWMVIAPLAGALDWRPHIMITAAAGSGKSSIMNYILDPLFKPWAHFKAENPTEAGIRQTVGPDASVVMLDEFDTNTGLEQKGRLQGILNLARVAASDGTITRGTTGGKALRYNAKFAAIFSGVNPPQLVEADRSRITELTLTPNHVRKNWQEYRTEMENLFPRIANSFLWNSIDQAKNIIASSRVLHTIISEHQGARMGQQLGTLLAGYHHFTHSEVITAEQARLLVEKQTVPAVAGEETAPTTDTDECYTHLMYLIVTMNEDRIPVTLETWIHGKDTNDTKNEVLSQFGMRLEKRGLFIPNRNPLLQKHFASQVWADWTKTLARYPGVSKGSMRVRGPVLRGIFLPVEYKEDKF